MSSGSRTDGEDRIGRGIIWEIEGKTTKGELESEGSLFSLDLIVNHEC